MENKSKMDLYQCIKIHLQRYSGKRVSAFEWQGHKIWIKQAEKVKYSIWLRVAKWLSRLIKNPLISPTLEIDGLKALKIEAKRLKFLCTQGVFVPQLLAQGKDWIAISDTGKPVRELLQSNKVKINTKMHILQSTSRALAEMHLKNLYHGRPALKDFTWDGEKVGFLDFEENSGSILSIQQCMVRDVLIYIHSLFREVGSVRLIYLAILSYRKYASQLIWKCVLQEAADLKFLYFLLRYTYPYMGTDAKNIYRTLHALYCLILMERRKSATIR
ncbi:BUD32 family EKC/KEOPS complex subunit [Propionispira raffinosivorans]|uniref:hypothetical protein n=1 Tax=Propionispira raffinosivorans TaxID=86959 RepID=UPI0003804651|nr:hypothetical protein [Propionispira raffinosivorans]